MDNGRTIARESDDASWKQASVSKIRFFPERVSISVTVLAGAFKLFQFRSISFPKWSNLLSLPFSTFLFFPPLRFATSTTLSVLFHAENTVLFSRARVEWTAGKRQESFGRSFLRWPFTSISYVLEIVCSLPWHEEEGRLSGSRRGKAICECGKSKFHRNSRIGWKWVDTFWTCIEICWYRRDFIYYFQFWPKRWVCKIRLVKLEINANVFKIIFLIMSKYKFLDSFK